MQYKQIKYLIFIMLVTNSSLSFTMSGLTRWLFPKRSIYEEAKPTSEQDNTSTHIRTQKKQKASSSNKVFIDDANTHNLLLPKIGIDEEAKPTSEQDNTSTHIRSYTRTQKKQKASSSNKVFIDETAQSTALNSDNSSFKESYKEKRKKEGLIIDSNASQIARYQGETNIKALLATMRAYNQSIKILNEQLDHDPTLSPNKFEMKIVHLASLRIARTEYRLKNNIRSDDPIFSLE
ncbi:hypothetical protein KBC04_00050 [Candidatus Babeliales bacterium]|nr:hypothetical protein [Candidatus Babeliales bacterium]MBP9843515.1 hypothetical protein [Candidatus Babeliales bacterium]